MEETGKKQANQTAWQPGQSGNPSGGPKKGHSITETVREMMDQQPEIKRQLVSKVFAMALHGDLTAIKTIWQYLDGLPKQTTELIFFAILSSRVYKGI